MDANTYYLNKYMKELEDYDKKYNECLDYASQVVKNMVKDLSKLLGVRIDKHTDDSILEGLDEENIFEIFDIIDEHRIDYENFCEDEYGVDIGNEDLLDIMDYDGYDHSLVEALRKIREEG